MSSRFSTKGKPATTRRYSWVGVLAVLLIGCFEPGEVARSDSHIASEAPKKIALIIAISKYKDSLWRPINSTNDIPLIEQALMAHGFLEQNIYVVKDKDATKEGILGRLNDEFIPKIEKNDIVYFHFSGHGQRIRDNNCDEIDGFDESLVPHDGPARPGTSYAGEKHIRDDDVEKIVNALRLAAGPKGDVIVALDSCFSGTGSRGFAPVRGGEPRIGSAQECENRSDTSKTIIGSNENPDMAKHVVFSASRFNELAREVEVAPKKYVGSLSLGLSSALPDASMDTTYRHLFEGVKRNMAANVRNNPQLEGEANRKIFGGSAVTQEPYYEVVGIKENLVRIRAGKIRGVLEGATVEFHAPGTRTPASSTLIASGEVVGADAIFSDVMIDNPTDDESVLTESSAFVTDAAFGTLIIKVRIVSDDAAWTESLTERIDELKVAQATADPTAELEIRDLRQNSGTVQIIDPSDDFVVTEYSGSDPNLPKHVADLLQSYAKNKFLKGFELQARGIAGKLEILHCEAECELDAFTGREKCDCKALVPLSEAKIEGESTKVVIGEKYKFRIINTGLRATYNYLLALISNGDIALLYPPLNTDGQTLARAKSFEVDTVFEMGEPRGTDVVMLVSSIDPIDFWPVVSGSASGSKGSKNSFDLLMEDSFLGHRGPKPTFPLGSVSTSLSVVTVVDDESATP